MNAPGPLRVSRDRIARAAGILFASCALFAAACHTSDPAPTAPAEVVTRSVLEFGEVVSAETPGATKFARYDATQPDVYVAGTVRYEVESAKVERGSGGRPSVAFVLSKEDGAAFRAWTAARIRRPMAVILDRKVVLHATIHEALPGAGVLEFGEPGITKEEAARIAKSLTAPK